MVVDTVLFNTKLFINGELVGRVADPNLPWAMIFPFVDSQPRHPSQLYQALTEGLLLFIILWLYASKPRPTMSVSGVFMISYGSLRFFTEFFRTPDSGYDLYFGWMTKGQLYSGFMIIGAIAIIVAKKLYRPHKPE